LSYTRLRGGAWMGCAAKRTCRGAGCPAPAWNRVSGKAARTVWGWCNRNWPAWGTNPPERVGC